MAGRHEKPTGSGNCPLRALAAALDLHSRSIELTSLGGSIALARARNRSRSRSVGSGVVIGTERGHEENSAETRSEDGRTDADGRKVCCPVPAPPAHLSPIHRRHTDRRPPGPGQGATDRPTAAFESRLRTAGDAARRHAVDRMEMVRVAGAAAAASGISKCDVDLQEAFYCSVESPSSSSPSSSKSTGPARPGQARGAGARVPSTAGSSRVLADAISPIIHIRRVE